MDNSRIELDIDDLEEPEQATNTGKIYRPLSKYDESNRIVISVEDLKDVQEVFTAGNAVPFHKEMPKIPGDTSSTLTHTIVSSMIAGLIGGVLAWGIVEVIMPADKVDQYASAADIILKMGLLFALVGLIIGAALGSINGITSKNSNQALQGGLIGAVTGLGGGFIGGAIAQGVYGYILNTIIYSSDLRSIIGPIMIVRGLGWGIAGMIFGMGSAILSKVSKKIVNSLLGGLIGGIVGGLLFDPIAMVVGNGTISRMVAITVIGGFIGGAIGLIENLRKEAWLKTVSGRMKNKEFIIYKEETVLGCTGKCDIVLFKDPGVAPRHAVITLQRGNYYIHDLNTVTGTYVNNQKISSRMLRNGDMIQLGETCFIYNEKAIKK